MGEWVNVITVFGSTIGALIAYVVGSKVWEAVAPKILERRYARQDHQNALHETNQTAEYDFKTITLQKLTERLDRVETRADALQDQLNSLMVQNERLKTENEHLKETNERQEKEITELRNDRTILQGQVNSLTNLVVQLKLELDSLKKNSNDGL